MNPNLLIELLTEELPPKSLAKLAVAFRDGLQKSLAEAGYIATDNEGQWFATPRRLVARFENCHETQPDRVIEKGSTGSPFSATNHPLNSNTYAGAGTGISITGIRVMPDHTIEATLEASSDGQCGETLCADGVGARP